MGARRVRLSDLRAASSDTSASLVNLIDAGNDPPTVMEFSGHRTDSMLKRYHVINVADLRRAAARGGVYTGRPGRWCRCGGEQENPESQRPIGVEG
jgi:hypothetical protein